MRIGAFGFLGLLACACAPDPGPTVEATPVATGPEPDVPVEPPPPVASRGGGVAAMHRQALADADPARAARTLEQACERGFAPSCIALADRLESGEGVEADPERARGLLEETCLDGSTVACDRLGH